LRQGEPPQQVLNKDAIRPGRPRSKLRNMSERSILVVEDEKAIAEAVRARLASEGFGVRVVHDGSDALRATASSRPDLVVLDLMLPGMDGLEVCQRMQKEGWIPVLMLTARTDEADKIAGFAVGADDYLTKPFSLRELVARVRAILRRMDRIRSVGREEALVRFDVVVDPARRRVSREGQDISLTPLEFEILLTLARAPGLVFTREQLMDRIWGYRDYAGGRVVDSHVARIRRKLGDEAAEPRYIRTVHGVGYAFVEGG
jgi:DNA-binding response OmpR family regulator